MTSREKRKRAYIPKDEITASLIGDHLLTRAERDRLRAAKVPAENVIRLTTPDHVALHALDGSDAWWNLTIKLRGPELKAKDNRDTSIVAKSDRLVAERQRQEAAMRAKLLGPSPSFVNEPRRSRWPQGRKLQSRSSFQRRQP